MSDTETKREIDPDTPIRERFRVGAARVYGRLVWRELFKLPAAKNYSGRALASVAGLDESVPSKGKTKGELSFPYLVMLMTALKVSPRRTLPDLPPKDRPLVGGYRDALLFVRHIELERRPYRDLEVEDVDCLMLAYRKEYNVASAAERHSMAASIVERVGGRAKIRAKAADGAYEYVRQLRSDWTDAWIKTVNAIKAKVGWTRQVSS